MGKINLPCTNVNNVKKNDIIKEDIKKTTGWREKNSYIITAIISGKLISIDVNTFEILFSNSFKIRCKSLEAAKEKAMSFFGS